MEFLLLNIQQSIDFFFSYKFLNNLEIRVISYFKSFNIVFFINFLIDNLSRRLGVSYTKTFLLKYTMSILIALSLYSIISEFSLFVTEHIGSFLVGLLCDVSIFIILSTVFLDFNYSFIKSFNSFTVFNFRNFINFSVISVEYISIAIKALSVALRINTNMISGHLLLLVLYIIFENCIICFNLNYYIFSLIISIFVLLLEFLVIYLQLYVMVLLSSLYTNYNTF